MMLTSIPYFREIILMSFRCEHCGGENNEIQDAGTIRGESGGGWPSGVTRVTDSSHRTWAFLYRQGAQQW
jgi:hypothetical protein